MIPLFKVFMSEKSAEETSKFLPLDTLIKDKVDEFENILGNFFTNKNVVTTNSATSAEHLAIHMLKDPRY